MNEHEKLPVVKSAGSCCGWSPLALWLGVTLPAIIAAVFFAGAAWRDSMGPTSPSVKSTSPMMVDAAIADLPVANATAAVRDDDYSIATGLIADLTEALFVLDHNSGLLQCNVMYPRINRFLGQFQINVADALGGGARGGKYLMCTGTADFLRSNQRPVAPSVVYVLDTASGNYACFGIPFNRVDMNANRPQQGPLVLIASGQANPIVDRDELR